MVDQGIKIKPITADEFDSFLVSTSRVSASVGASNVEFPSEIDDSPRRVLDAGIEFAFRGVPDTEVVGLIMEISSDAVWLDEIPMVFVKSLELLI